jgi:hypothetical protein
VVGPEHFANTDEEWRHLLPQDLYYAQSPVAPERPLFQGDVFADIPVPDVDGVTESKDAEPAVRLTTHTVMVVPHPCSCYYGDTLRPKLTVAIVRPLATGTKIDWRPLNNFPLPAIRAGIDGIADIGELVTIPSSWLVPSNRVACLTLNGTAWLHKRILKYTTRLMWLVANLETGLLREWDDVAVWTAWRMSRGTFDGYAAWKKAAVEIPVLGLNRPDDVIPGRTANLVAYLMGEPPPQ